MVCVNMHDVAELFSVNVVVTVAGLLVTLFLGVACIRYKCERDDETATAKGFIGLGMLLAFLITAMFVYHTESAILRHNLSVMDLRRSAD